MNTSRTRQDFPPGLLGGLEHDDTDHRVGETGQTGPESPGDVDRSHSGHPGRQGGRPVPGKDDDVKPQPPKR
ncbi:hypothetical protein CDN99_01475 [Roseateles aquatilis]|uniref:Uncharacterized protein n=1 Tax=Roseateles aquatilis TaxID=431061 RepID=A0A246JKL4_9BURK|nr:hypothetical protein [Roseateles aquatilis]OWQ93194.1 hypothetical protein CDN99_01475 [Roseateles aquatilis]